RISASIRAPPRARTEEPGFGNRDSGFGIRDWIRIAGIIPNPESRLLQNFRYVASRNFDVMEESYDWGTSSPQSLRTWRRSRPGTAYFFAPPARSGAHQGGQHATRWQSGARDRSRQRHRQAHRAD